VSLPPEIYGYKVVFKVSPYVAPVLQCKKCFMYNHGTNACRGQERCQKCGNKAHKQDENCPETKYCNVCKEEGHSAFNRKSCPKWEEQKEIKKTMAYGNLSYAQAAYKGIQHPTQSSSVPNGSQQPQPLHQIQAAHQNIRQLNSTPHQKEAPLSKEFIVDVAVLFARICDSMYHRRVLGEEAPNKPAKPDESILLLCKQLAEQLHGKHLHGHTTDQ